MKIEGITLTQNGQPRPYADSVYAGTVKAQTKKEARNKLEQMRGPVILDSQDKGDNWHLPYFTLLKETGPGLWAFRIQAEYTG